MSIIKLIFSTIYFYLRSVIKWFFRYTTHMCELQRICYYDEWGAIRTLNVEFSLENTQSKDLRKTMHLMDNKAKDKGLSEDAVFYAVFAAVRVKKVNIKIHKRFPELLGECIFKIWSYRQMMESLEVLRSTKYDSGNDEHEEKLLSLWDKLNPEVALNKRISKQWQDIGFQGDDPSTDFRGMGLLGLENLLFFAETHPYAAQHVLMRSKHPHYGYSYAIVGINICQLAYNLVKEGLAKIHFYNSSKQFLDTHHFFQFFCVLFFEFDVLWRQERPKDIMEFSRVRTKFEEEVRSKLRNKNALFKCSFVLENV